MAVAAAMLCCAASAQAAVSNDSLVALQQKNKYTELWIQRSKLFNTLGVKRDNIVMLGNSLIQGGDWARMLENDKIVNRGIIGDIVQGMIDRIDCVVDGKPAKIFIEAGANDISHNVTPDSIVRVYARLIDTIKARSPRTQIYVHSLLPINNSFGRYKAMKDKEQDIRDTNKLLQPMAESKGCTFINLHPLLTDADGNLRAEYTSDGLHLKPDAYLIWYTLVAPYMRR